MLPKGTRVRSRHCRRPWMAATDFFGHANSTVHSYTVTSSQRDLEGRSRGIPRCVALQLQLRYAAVRYAALSHCNAQFLTSSPVQSSPAQHPKSKSRSDRRETKTAGGSATQRSTRQTQTQTQKSGHLGNGPSGTRPRCAMFRRSSSGCGRGRGRGAKGLYPASTCHLQPWRRDMAVVTVVERDWIARDRTDA